MYERPTKDRKEGGEGMSISTEAIDSIIDHLQKDGINRETAKWRVIK